MYHCNDTNNMYPLIIKIKKLPTIVEGNPKAPFSIATTPKCRGGCYSLDYPPRDFSLFSKPKIHLMGKIKDCKKKKDSDSQLYSQVDMRLLFAVACFQAEVKSHKSFQVILFNSCYAKKKKR